MNRFIAFILSLTSLLLVCSCASDEELVYDAPDYMPDASGRYGVRWNINDPFNLGERCFSAAGKKAHIGIGGKKGSSDFDAIYPWSEMRRCNIRDGRVLYEGEQGFALDGSNGDVFVRVPLFNIERYVEDDYEYRVISRGYGSPHPAFVEDGRVLDAVYVSAFEGFADKEGLHSCADVIPSSNMTAGEFLDLAQKRGENYTLYDMRTVDMLFDLIAVEYGCRNTSVIFGHGISQYKQPIEDEYEPHRIYYSKEIASGVNYFKGRNRTSSRKIVEGSNICICKGTQENVLTFARVTKIQHSSLHDYTIYHFDGPAIDIDTDCFIGNCAQSTNWTETCSAPLRWHSGRADMHDDYDPRQRNPMRYRWIENIVGNLWHYLPDVTFQHLQMYVCDNMRDYKMFCTYGPYRQVGEPFVENNDNSRQVDKYGINYWVTTLECNMNAPAVSFGRDFSQELLSNNAFGAYYYLRDGLEIVANGGGFDHEFRSNLLTNRAWIGPEKAWFLYGARLLYKDLNNELK